MKFYSCGEGLLLSFIYEFQYRVLCIFMLGAMLLGWKSDIPGVVGGQNIGSSLFSYAFFISWLSVTGEWISRFHGHRD